MIRIQSFFKTTKTIYIILYAIILLLLIPTFFFSYGGEWMKELARDIPIKEMDFEEE